MTDFTLIVPFYRNIVMLQRQVEEWNRYPCEIKIICVDDCSPEPAKPIIEEVTNGTDIELYRISIDKPWNREGARNLGGHHAKTEWIVQVDIDHILPADAALKLLEFEPDPNYWYRFPRWRKGKADDTRKKDLIPDDCEYGEIHPHVDSYLVRRDIYWQAGGYDEDYAGCLGGGSAFLANLENIQPSAILPAPIRLEVYTRSVIEDASDWSLSRDTSEGKRIRKEKAASGKTMPKKPLRFPWTREI